MDLDWYAIFVDRYYQHTQDNDEKDSDDCSQPRFFSLEPKRQNRGDQHCDSGGGNDQIVDAWGEALGAEEEYDRESQGSQQGGFNGIQRFKELFSNQYTRRLLDFFSDCIFDWPTEESVTG